MKNVKSLIRVAFWGFAGLLAMIWLVLIALIVLGVSGSYNLDYLILISVNMILFGILARHSDYLEFIWEGIDR